MDLFLYFFRSYPKRTLLVFFGVIIASIITALTLLALPALLASMLGRSTGKVEVLNAFFDYIGVQPSTENFVIFVISGIVLQNLILAASRIYSGFTVAKIIKDLRIRMLTSMSQTEWGFFIRQSSGRFTSKLINDVEKAGGGYLTMVDILAIGVQIIAYLSVAFIISWQVGLIAVITCIVLTILFSRLIKISKKLGAADSKLVGKITSQVTDSYRSIKALKAMARESHTNALINSFSKELKNVTKKSTIVRETLNMSQEIVLMITIILTVYLSFDLLEIPIEYSIVLVILYLRSMRLFGKGQKYYQSYAMRINGFAIVRRTIERTDEHKEHTEGKIKYKIKGDIKLNNVSFSHDDKTILDHTTGTIYYRKLNTIIGPSGTGKTTVADLICGLFSPSSGEITVGEYNLIELDTRYWRSQIGYVLQENTLLNTSIRENITLGDSKYTDDDVFRALNHAHAIQIIEGLPNKINTIVGENGSLLSGGQRQRILIARALIHSPKLLILDEATSALDNETEKTLSKLFKELSKSITIISISHRPAIANVSDHILELEDGKLKIIK